MNEQKEKNILQTHYITSKIWVFDILDLPDIEISYIVILRFLNSDL